MIVYDRIWKKFEEKNMNQYRLIRYYGISPGLITRLKRNVPLTTKTINNLCKLLDCKVEDIMEYIPDEVNGDEKDDRNRKYSNKR